MATLLLLEMLLWKIFSGLRGKTSLTGRTENFVLARIRVQCPRMENAVLLEQVGKIS
jgi:hypothetical protein